MTAAPASQPRVRPLLLGIQQATSVQLADGWGSVVLLSLSKQACVT